jgi:3-oxochol-4-en-24-oyl-CoA dehydrogenase
MGLSPNKQVIFIEERERWGVARHPDQGVTMIGPLLMRYGTEEQKQRFLPKIIAGEHVWCQGYSEPNAGSDLASLATEAVADGDDFIINGTKIWTSLAHDATHMFLLARTDKTAKRQAGISFFLLDLKTPGVIVRPIPNIEGHSEFCQEFLENVRIPKENLVGELNKGWEVAKTLLTFERLNNGSPRRCSYSLNKLPIVARERGLWDDAEFQSKFTRMRLDVLDLGSSYKRYADILRQGKSPDPGISMLKIWQSETTLRLSELMLETASDAGYIRDEELAYGDDHVDVLGPFYAGLHTVISSGSNDIRNATEIRKGREPLFYFRSFRSRRLRNLLLELIDSRFLAALGMTVLEDLFEPSDPGIRPRLQAPASGPGFRPPLQTSMASLSLSASPTR